MANNYEAEKEYFAGKKPVKVTAKAKKEAEAGKQEVISKGRAIGAAANDFDKLSDKAKIESIKRTNLGVPVTTKPADILVPGESRPAQPAQVRIQTAVERNSQNHSTTRGDLPAGLRQTAEPILRPKVSRKELNETEASQRERISTRASRVSGPSLPPPFAQHRGVEEVLMQSRRAAKKTYTDASELAGVRGVLDHAARHLEDAGNHHYAGNYPAAHAALGVAVNSLSHAVNRIDKANGGGATSVHLSNAMQNHLNSYRDQYL